MEFISQRCTYLFESILRLPDFEMDTAIKPIHAPIHLQPTSKLEKIKSARGIYKRNRPAPPSLPTHGLGIEHDRRRTGADPTPIKAGMVRAWIPPRLSTRQSDS